jgi:HK97 family phage major capsid protein
MTILELQQRCDEINAESEAIVARAEAEHRQDLSEEERGELDQLIAEFTAKTADIARMEAIANQGITLTSSRGRRAPAEEPRASSDDAGDEEVPTPRPSMNGRQRRQEPNITVRTDRGRWGFHSFGEFASCVRMASINGGALDSRLHAMQMAPTTYGSEGVGVDGGFAVPPDFRTAIMEKVMGEASLISRTDQLVTSSNSITIPKDETTPWQTSGGIQAAWEGEGALKTQSKPALEQETIKLNKLVALVPVTDELLEDAPALETYLKRKAGAKIDFKINLAIVQGTGVGQPLGILNAPSTVTVAKETSQVADTIMFENVMKMYSRMYAPLRNDAVWLVNQDAELALASMKFLIKNVAGTENVGGTPVYLPAGGLSSSPYASLLGKPVIPTQAAETVGDLGDIIFVNLKEYMTVQRTAGGLKTDVSIHLFFDYDITAFRFVFRMGGKPWWTSAISPRDGSNTLSWAVALAERA